MNRKILGLLVGVIILISLTSIGTGEKEIKEPFNKLEENYPAKKT